MNSLTQLQLWVLEESGTQCGVNTLRDRKTILERIEHEGLSFLTITLPSFTKDFYKALAQERVDLDLFPSFKRRKGHMIPEFLSGFMSLLFDPVSGGMLDTVVVDPSDSQDPRKSLEWEAEMRIQAIIQVTGLMAKVDLPCSPKRVRAALSKYVENEGHVRRYDAERTPDMYREFRIMSHWLFGDVFNSVERLIKEDGIRPAHGPGATADKLYGNAKWNQPAWPERLEQVFPYGEYAFSSWRHYLDDVDSGSPEPGTEIPVKVITVPKTLKTPRIIAVEPTAMQYMQQGISRALIRALEVSDDTLFIRFSDQIPNQSLAKFASEYGSFATLDLSDASDLVSNQLIKTMLADFPLLAEAVDATRSRHADVSGHGIIPLAKYASMGSALCFPMEAIVFSTIIAIAFARQFPSLRRKELKELFATEVAVYGDDLIVDANKAQGVIETLEAFGLKVNRSKTFTEGFFRESCGKEYFYGRDITHVKCRYVLPSSLLSPRERDLSFVKSAELRNLLWKSGYWRTAGKIDALIEVHNYVFPAVSENSPAIGRLSSLGYQSDGWSVDLQKPMVKAYVVSNRIPESPLDGPGALMKFFLKNSELPNPDRNHLERAGRPASLRIKKRWTDPS